MEEKSLAEIAGREVTSVQVAGEMYFDLLRLENRLKGLKASLKKYLIEGVPTTEKGETPDSRVGIGGGVKHTQYTKKTVAWKKVLDQMQEQGVFKKHIKALENAVQENTRKTPVHLITLGVDYDLY